MSDYPEHEKLKAISDKSQTIGEFLDWLMWGGLDEAAGHPGGSRRESYGSIELAYRVEYQRTRMDDDGQVVAEMAREDTLTPLNWSIKQILAAYFEIDNDKIELEKMAMLEALRNQEVSL